MLGLVQSKQGGMGRPAKLSLADQLMATLMYRREYRTQFHIAQSYKVSEPTINRVINKVEHILVSSGKFNLPSKRSLEQNKLEYSFILIEVTETPVERPKKNKSGSIAERRSVTPSRPR
jgi:transcriptional antiterminator